MCTRKAIIGRFRSRMNTASSSANTNCCVMSGMYGIDRIHIDPFNTSRRCVPFRAEKRLPGCTRAHALRWQITPRWGCRIRNCGGPPTHQLPCRWSRSIELPPCLNRWHRCTCISSLLQLFDIPFLRTVPFDLRLQAQMHPAPTGRNLPAKGVSPGTGEQAWTVPEGDASAAMSISPFSIIAATPKTLASLYAHPVFSYKGSASVSCGQSHSISTCRFRCIQPQRGVICQRRA